MKSDRLFELLADKTDKNLLHWAKDNDMPDTFNLKLEKYMIQVAFANPPRLAILNWSNYLVAAFQHPALERVYELARRSAMHANEVIDCLIKELENTLETDSGGIQKPLQQEF